MTRYMSRNCKRRRGTVAVLVGVLAIPLLAMVAFSVDYGYLLSTRTDLQRAADAAALAAVQDLIEVSEGTEGLGAVRATVGNFAADNTDASFQVLDGDIEIGEYDPATIYSCITFVDVVSYYDAVRVTLRRDSMANDPVSLFFAPALGFRNSNVDVKATAVLQKSKALEPGAMILPIAVPIEAWEAVGMGDEWSIYADMRVEDRFGNVLPGNWGTVDIGAENNSTDALRDQILGGLSQGDLDRLYGDGRISQDTHIDSDVPAWLQADTGFSAGMKSAVQQIHGETRLVPIYDSDNGESGNNVEFHIVGWGVVAVVDSQFTGNPNKRHVTVRRSYAYHGELPPQQDLSNTEGVIQGAFTSPALVE